MPCFDGRENTNTHTVYVEKGTQTGRLCAVFKVLEQRGMLEQILALADWKGSGVSYKSTLEWWARHKEDDKLRQEQEKKEAARENKRKRLLEKLSPEEKALLGVR